jgi:hypothetical protein
MTDVTVTGQSSTSETVQAPATESVTTSTAPAIDPKILQEEIQKALKPMLETSRREIQSIKDKSKAEIEAAQRRARNVEQTLGAVNTRLYTLDPETAKELELTRFRAEANARTQEEQEQAAIKSQADFITSFSETNKQFVTDLGIDPNNPEIDWGADAATPLDALKRIQTSVAKIQKKDKENLKLTMSQQIQAEVAKALAKASGTEALEANSVDTAMSGGVPAAGLPNDKAKFEAYVAGLSTADYKKNKAAIEAQYAKLF